MTNVHGGGKPAEAVLNDLRRDVADLAKAEVDKPFTNDPVANASSSAFIEAVRRLREFEDSGVVLHNHARDHLALLREARDLLRHDGRHTRRTDETEYPPCAGCDLEARIDAALDA